MENDFNNCRPTQLQAAVCYIIAVVGVRLFGFNEYLLPLKYAALVVPLFLYRRSVPNMVHSMRNTAPSVLHGGMSIAIGVSAGLSAAFFIGGKAEMTWTALLLRIITSGILAAVCEELLFRGFLFPAGERTGTAYAVILSSVLFVTLHTARSGLPEELAMGIVLALLTLYTDSVISAILCHSAYNCTVIAAAAVGIARNTLFGILCAVLALLLTAAVIKTGRRAKHLARPELIGRFELCIFLCGIMLYVATI